MATPNPCQLEATAFVQCRAMDSAGTCGVCAPVYFNTIQLTFPAGLKQKFMSSQASASMGTPEFCDAAEERICADWDANACCCAPEVTAWQSCLVEKDFSPGANIETPCTVSCAADEGGGDGDSGSGGTMMIVIAIVLVLAIGGGVGGFFFMRKRRAAANGEDDKSLGSDDDDESFKKNKKNKKNKNKKGDKNKKAGGWFSRGEKDSDETDVPRGSDEVYLV